MPVFLIGWHCFLHICEPRRISGRHFSLPDWKYVFVRRLMAGRHSNNIASHFEVSYMKLLIQNIEEKFLRLQNKCEGILTSLRADVPCFFRCTLFPRTTMERGVARKLLSYPLCFFRCFELLSAFFELSFQVLEDWLRDRNNNKITNDTCSESLFDKAFAVKLQKLFPKLQPLRKKVGKRGMVSIRAYRPPAQNTKEYSSKIFPTSIKLETLILVSCSGWCICSVGRSVIRQLGQSFLRSLISRKSIVRIILHFFIPSVHYHVRLLIRWCVCSTGWFVGRSVHDSVGRSVVRSSDDAFPVSYRFVYFLVHSFIFIVSRGLSFNHSVS